MKISAFLILALFILTGTASAAPQIFVEKPTFNFGTIVQGKKADHTFLVKNNGDSALNILNVRPACGCTAANASVPVITPGKSSEIKVSFNSSNFSGSVVKTISVETNDPQTPTYTLTMTGTVTEEVDVTPKPLNLGQVKPEIQKIYTLNLTNRSNKLLKLISVTSPMTQVIAKFDKASLKVGESTTISVSVTPRSEDRMLSGYLTITTDHPKKTEVMVPVYGSIAK